MWKPPILRWMETVLLSHTIFRMWNQESWVGLIFHIRNKFFHVPFASKKVVIISRIGVPWCEQVNWVIYLLNIIIAAWFNESISTPGISIEVEAVHFCSTHFQLGNWHSSSVPVQRTKYAAFLQRGWQVSSFGKEWSAHDF